MSQNQGPDPAARAAIIDSHGVPIGVVRIGPTAAHLDVAGLLKRYIDQDDLDAWMSIRIRIDYIYQNLDYGLGPLDSETGFCAQVRARTDLGKKLLFKPNLVYPRNIDPLTHDKADGSTACTPWPFVAALMRWFHDKLGVYYHQMAIGEAATAMASTAGLYDLAYGGGGCITTEAVIEGRSGDFYGGWGFYFVRKYLSDTHDPSHTDDPMAGYEDSVAGRYVAPGRATDRLMVYDLNLVDAIPYRGREVDVPNGANFSKIMLHKAIVGGDPADPKDLEAYPGCVLINVPQLKVHGKELLTNAIKNIGIGLYPMQAGTDGNCGNCDWTYAFPHKPVPGMKRGLPHTVWYPVIDAKTGLGERDDQGEYVLARTEGMFGTMADILQALKAHGVFTIHVSDAITAVNIDHMLAGTRVPEGYVFASLDPVALDLLCARYLFNMVPMAEAEKIRKQQNLSTEFINIAPIPRLADGQIVSDAGFDSPLSRYPLFTYLEERALGKREYHVIGEDRWHGGRLASVNGHLGKVEAGGFIELITRHLYWSAMKPVHDLQATVFAYVKACDGLTGSNHKQRLLDLLDENGDGVIDYTENGTRGATFDALGYDALSRSLKGSEKFGFLKGPFLNSAERLKVMDARWNVRGSDIMETSMYNLALLTAYQMATGDATGSDAYCSGLQWGNGKWPTIEYARHVGIRNRLFGQGFPYDLSISSLYGYAFQYADKAMNGAHYTGTPGTPSPPGSLNNYILAVKKGAGRLSFTLYVPVGYGGYNGLGLPNVEETTSPDLAFRASFDNGRELW